MRKYFNLSKYLLISFFSMAILTTLVFLSYSFYSYNRIKTDITYSGEESFKRFTSNTNTIFTNFDNTSIQIAMLPSVNELLHQAEPGYLNTFIAVRDNLESFSVPGIYQSIAVYFEASDQVYTTYGGLYPLNEFYDQSFISDYVKDQAQSALLYPPRTTVRYFARPPTREVISFVRQAPLFGTPKGWVIININTESLAEAVISAAPASPMYFGLVQNGQVFYANGPIIKANDPNYIHYQADLHGYGLKTVGALPKSLIKDRFFEEIGIVFMIFLLILIGEFFLSFFFSNLLSAPINLIIAQVQSKNPKQNKPRLQGIEGLNQALENLFVHTDNISAKYQQNIPVLREGILLNMLWDNNLSAIDLDHDDLSQYGIAFPHPYVYTFIAYTEEMDQINTPAIKDQIRLYIKENVSTVFSQVGTVYSVFLGGNKLAFLFNTDLDPYGHMGDHQTISGLFASLHTLMRDELGIHVAFSFGTKEDAYTNLNRSYKAANNNLMFASIFDDEFLVFYEEGYNAPVLNKIPLRHLIDDIADKNYSGVEAYTEMIGQQYFGKDQSFEKGKELLIYLVSSLYIGLWEKGVDVNPKDLTASLSLIHNMTDFNDIQSYLSQTIQNLSCSLGFCQDTVENKNVTGALDFIHQHYQRDISVMEIADHAGLNQVYLNRIFKLSTGKTLSEYLNAYRIEQSKALLDNKDLSITDISSQLGYNDVRSYTRFFKKFVGITPSEYRG